MAAVAGYSPSFSDAAVDCLCRPGQIIRMSRREEVPVWIVRVEINVKSANTRRGARERLREGGR